MGHMIDGSTGDDAYVERGERVTAWHKRGRTLRPDEFDHLSGEEKVQRILEAGRLDWTVDPYDLFDETGRRVEGYHAFRRSDNDHLMTVAPSSYTILQNSELLTLVEPFLNEGVFTFETAGALRDGEDVWALFKFNPQDPAVMDFFDREEIHPFALLANNHSYRRVVSIMETPIRVVCANTLSMALNALPGKKRKSGRYPGAVQLRHTKNVKSLSVDAVTDLWGEITERYAALAASYEALQERFLTEEEFESAVLEPLAPFPEDEESKQYESTFMRAMDRRNFVEGLYFGAGSGITGEPTAWNAYNAAVEAVDHFEEYFPVRTNRLRGIFPGGSLANKKQDVLNNLHELAVAG